ncbi:MAG: hypothetical protein QW524_01345 [Candidatus Woesearchaeota archaeon]
MKYTNKALIFGILIFFMFSVSAELISLCDYNNKSLSNYSINAEIKILASNKIMSGDVVPEIYVYSNNTRIGVLNDIGKGCDDVKEDGVYCGYIKASDIVGSIVVVYSKIANESLNFTILQDNFSTYEIKCFPDEKDSNNAICRILSNDTFVLNGNIITEISGLQGSLRDFTFYQYTSLCGKRKRTISILFPDFQPPKPVELNCTTASNNVVQISWSKSEDNTGIKYYEVFKCSFPVSMKDEEKITSFVDKAKCNLTSFKIFKENEELRFEDYCDNCEIYYKVRVYDIFNNSVDSKICRTFSDSSKPNVEYFLQYPDKILILYGDAHTVFYDKLYPFKNGMSLNYDKNLSIIFYDKFGNFVMLKVNEVEEFPFLDVINDKVKNAGFYSNESVYRKDMKKESFGRYYYVINPPYVFRYEISTNHYTQKNSFVFIPKAKNFTIDGHYRYFKLENDEVDAILISNATLIITENNVRYRYDLESDENILDFLTNLRADSYNDKEEFLIAINKSLGDYYLDNYSLKRKSTSLLELTGFFVKGDKLRGLFSGISLILLIVVIIGIIFLYILISFLKIQFRQVNYRKNFLKKMENKRKEEQQLLKKLEEKKKKDELKKQAENEFIKRAVEEEKKIEEKEVMKKGFRYRRNEF